MPSQPLSWKTLEYVYREKTSDWYWAVGIIAVSVATTAILFHDTLFAVVILLAAFSLALYAKRKPKLVQCKVDEKGVQFGKDRYPYFALESFWVEDRFGENKIIIKSKKITMPYLVVPITEEISPNVVRAFLKAFLPEAEHTESVSKKVMEYLGF